MTFKLPNKEAQPPKLDAEKIPKDCHQFIPLAEKYGISDDGYRIDVLECLDEDEKNELISFANTYPSSLDDWLCGPESESKEPSIEYVTFTALIMAADYVQ